MALKRLHRLGPLALARFKREFRALRDIHHPHVARLYGLFQEADEWFIAMEVVAGDDLYTACRPSQELNLARTRGTFAEVTLGLMALHEHGVVHRDLKPTNVRLRSDGSAALLDFGLITGLAPERQSSHGGSAGTPAYMAPEQALEEHIDERADWYGLGVCLYEVLTGQLPFDGPTPLQILLSKQNAHAPRPTATCDDIPEELDELCTRLLNPDPALRPRGSEVLDILSPGHALRDVSRTIPTGTTNLRASTKFAGRESELKHLEGALDRTHQGHFSMVLIEGESGVGKSALVAEFVARQRQSAPDTLVLTGRCYEDEHIAFRAFDGCIDGLSQFLRRLDDSQCEALLPPGAVALGQLFPALRTVRAVARTSTLAVSSDPTTRRLDAFEALAELLSRIAEDRPLILNIDDLHWADPESFRLLHVLVEHTPSPPVLLTATLRSCTDLPDPARREVAWCRDLPCTDHLLLLGLSSREADELARSMLVGDPSAEWIRRLARESGGHPLLLTELASYAAHHETSYPSLQAALHDRIATLEPAPRALLNIVALAGRPYPDAIFARSLSGQPLVHAARELISKRLLRRRRQDELTTYHDAIRECAQRLLPRATRRHLHAQLAEALHAHGIERAEVARHLEHAGALDRASKTYEQAADSALESLAFAQAQALYTSALRLLRQDDTSRERRLQTQLGRTLSLLGRSEQAVAAFRRAAELSPDPEEGFRLRLRIASRLLDSARVDEGLAAADDVLREVGAPLPRSTAGALARLALAQTRASVRGLRWKRRAPDTVDPVVRRRLDTVQELGVRVAWMHMLAGATMSLEHLNDCLVAGAPRDAARALANEAAYRGLKAPRKFRKHQALMERAVAMVDADAPADVHAEMAWQQGALRLFTYDVIGARETLESAHTMVLEVRAPGGWLLTNIRMGLGGCMYYLGEGAALAQRTERWIQEAEEKQDRFAIAAITGLGAGYVTHLVRDAPAEALAALRRALEHWPQSPFGLAHVGHVQGVVTSLLYEGEGGAWPWLLERETTFENAPILRLHYMRSELSRWRGQAAIAALLSGTAHARQSVESDVRALRKLGSTLDLAHADSLEGQLLALNSNRSEARHVLERAAHRYQSLGKQLYATIARCLVDASEGSKESPAADELARAGWSNPWRAVQAHAPAVAALRGSRPKTDTAQRIAGRYESLQPLGSGGSGTLSLVRDTQTGRLLALKQLRIVSADSLALFKREFRVLQGVHHPNLVRLEALFEDDGRWYIGMEFVPGDDLLAHTGKGPNCEILKLRHAMGQVVQALNTLHATGFVHRDVTPNNIRITPEGRAVLLDFGLVTTLDIRETTTVPNAGTLSYMAPEQLTGGDLSPTTDAYAVGACIYEALTGLPPFDQPSLAAMVQAKTRGQPIPPAVLNSSVDQRLATLCSELLERNPHARRCLSDLDAMLHVRRSPVSASAEGPGTSADGGYMQEGVVGRERELQRLRQLLDTRRSGLTAGIIEGDSGHGKTSLLAHALRDAAAKSPSLIVLRGRCYEAEQLPYKAFDDCMDQLARWLRRQPHDHVRAILPRKAALLAELFPVLGSVSAVAHAARKALPADPSVRRLAALDALASLIHRIGSEHPMVFAVDDIHWADAESARLLRHLMNASPRLTLVCTRRPNDREDALLAQTLTLLQQHEGTVHLTLGLLDRQASEKLARQGLAELATDARVEAIAREADGHPLYLAELIRHAKNGAFPEQGLSLHTALHRRIASLPKLERTLLTHAALVGVPLGRHVLEHVCADHEPAAATSRLLADKLLRGRADGAVACYHERIRDAALSLWAPQELVDLARTLANALDHLAPDLTTQRARLWEAAGHPARAAAAYRQAGREAMDAFAFDHALSHFGRALQQMESGERCDDWVDVMTERAEAAACAGRSELAAASYGNAAEQCADDKVRSLRLRTKRALHLLQSAQVGVGRKEARKVLREAGIALPEHGAVAMAELLRNRLLLKVRGLDVYGSAPPDGSKQHLALEVLRDLALAVGWTNVLLGGVMNVRYLRVALESGEAAHAAGALCQEAAIRALTEPASRDEFEPLFERARELAQRAEQPQASALWHWQRASAHHFCYEFDDAYEHNARAHALLETRCPGHPWLLTNVRMNLGAASYATARFDVFSHQYPQWERQAHETNDQFARTALLGVGHGFVYWLMRDDPEGLRAELTETMASWPREPFGLSMVGELLTLWAIDAYDPSPISREELQTRVQCARSGFLIKTRFGKALLDTIETFARLSTLAREGRSPHASDERQFEAFSRRLARSGLRHELGSAHHLRGQVALLQGQRDAAREHFRQAAEIFEECGHHLVTLGTRYVLGRLIGGDAGNAMCDQVLAAYSHAGWRRPLAGLRVQQAVIDAL